MEEEELEKKEEGQVIAANEECNKEEALQTMRLLEKALGRLSWMANLALKIRN